MLLILLKNNGIHDGYYSHLSEKPHTFVKHLPLIDKDLCYLKIVRFQSASGVNNSVVVLFFKRNFIMYLISQMKVGFLQ